MVSALKVFGGTGVSPVQAQAEACDYRTAEGGSIFSWFWVFLWNMNGWFPSSCLGTPCRQSSCFARELSIYCTRWPKQELGEIYVPKQELGHEGKAESAALSRPTGWVDGA